ncbi:phage head-tail connector protein [uncultured Staphylococcus sp.]|uniref:phage head-tail connector protein n=1 Tax=uncultured Staphylococcus sp. TaxID=189668 RepID=UPI0025CCFA22|nr:phage head-tail connector protein [uncultured Staphylococcus sp.]
MKVYDVKVLNQSNVEDSSQDEKIETLIEIYKGIADEYCNTVFIEPYPFGVKKFIADCIKYGATGNLASRSMGTVSYSYVTNIPDSIYNHLKPFRKLRW